MELPQATPLQLKALKNEDKARNELNKLCDLYRFHYEENNSQTRDYYLQKFGKLMDRARQKYRLILFIRGTTSIPPAVDEEEDDSLEELIPSFFFDEEKDDSTNDVVKSIFSVLNEDRNNSTRARRFQFEEIVKSAVNDFENDKLKNQMKLGECLNIILNSSRCLFDRGKNKLKFDFISWFPLYIKIVQKLVYNNEYQSDGFSSDSIACVIANDGKTTTAWKMFVQMLPMVILGFEHNFFFNHTLPIGVFSCHCLHSADTVFDRGKGTELTQESTQSVHDYKFSFSLSNTCSLILDECSNLWATNNRHLVFEFIMEGCKWYEKMLSVNVGFELLCKEACSMQATILSTQAFQQKLFYRHSLQSPVYQEMEIQSLNVLLLVEYLRWEFNLLSPGLRSGSSINASAHAFATAQFYVCRISCDKLLVAYECNSTRYPHWYHTYLQRFVCHGLPNTIQLFYGACLIVSADIHTQGEILVLIHQILHVRLMMEYLRWKCKLFLPKLWSLINVHWIDMGCSSILCWDTNWYYQTLKETLMRIQSLVFFLDGNTYEGSQDTGDIHAQKAEPKILVLEVGKGHFYPSGIDLILQFLLLISETYRSSSIREKSMITTLNPYFECLPTVKFSQPPTILIGTRYSIRSLSNQGLLVVIQILSVLLRIEFLRWKYKLFSTKWWSNRFYEAGIHHQIVANCVAKLICVLPGRLEQFAIFFFDILAGSVRWRQTCGDTDMVFLLQIILHHTSQDSYNTIPALVRQPVMHSGLSRMHIYFRIWNFPSVCSQVTAPLYSTEKHQDSAESSIKMMELPFLLTGFPHGSNADNIVGIQVSHLVIKSPHKLVRVEYLRFFRRGSFLHYLASVFYGALTVLSKAEIAYSKYADSTDDKTPFHLGKWRRRMSAQLMLKVIQTLYVWLWVDYLRWKFRLLPTGLWNERNVKGIPMGSTSVLCSSPKLELQDQLSRCRHKDLCSYLSNHDWRECEDSAHGYCWEPDIGKVSS